MFSTTLPSRRAVVRTGGGADAPATGTGTPAGVMGLGGCAAEAATAEVSSISTRLPSVLMT